MKRNLMAQGALCLSLLFLLTACGPEEKQESIPRSDSDAPAIENLQPETAAEKKPEIGPETEEETATEAKQEPKSAPEPEKAPETRPAPAVRPQPKPAPEPQPTPEEEMEPQPLEPPEVLLKTDYSDEWEARFGTGPQERIYRLILGADGMAQLVVQDGVRNLLELSHGGWSMVGDDQLDLQLDVDMAQENSGRKSGDHFGGLYQGILMKDTAMSLSRSMEADRLVPDQETVVFYRYSVIVHQGPPASGEQLCQAALAYYKAAYGSPYPGVAAVERNDSGGMLIHLYENMETHIATGGWYLIDPETLKGTDEITGLPVDFGPYLK